MTKSSKNHRILPVFAVAIGVAVGGVWLAVAPATELDSSRVEPSAPTDPSPPKAGIIGGPVRFERLIKGRTSRVVASQRLDDGEHEVVTRLSLRITDEAPTEPSGPVRRSYGDVAVSMESDGEPFGVDLNEDVARQIATARYELNVAASGRTERAELMSVEAKQLAQVLAVLEQVIDLATPRVPLEPVTLDDTWTWEVGNIPLLAQVTGRTPAGVVVEIRSPNGSAADGYAIWDDAAGEFSHTVLHWTGQVPASDDHGTVKQELRIELKSE